MYCIMIRAVNTEQNQFHQLPHTEYQIWLTGTATVELRAKPTRAVGNSLVFDLQNTSRKKTIKREKGGGGC